MYVYPFHSPKSLFSTHQLRATHKALLSFHNVNHSPILWPVACPISLVQPDETAKNFGHHSGCISDMESQALLIKQTDPIISCFMLYKTILFIIHAFTLTKLLLQFLLEVQKNPLNICWHLCFRIYNRNWFEYSFTKGSKEVCSSLLYAIQSLFSEPPRKLTLFEHNQLWFFFPLKISSCALQNNE